MDVAVPGFYVGLIVLLGQGGGILGMPIAYVTSNMSSRVEWADSGRGAPPEACRSPANAW